MAHVRHHRDRSSSRQDFPFPSGFLIFAHWKVKMFGVVYNKRGKKIYGRHGFFFKLLNALGCSKILLKTFLSVFSPHKRKI